MDTRLFDTFRNNLLEKRKNIADWLLAAPRFKSKARLGPGGEEQVQETLREIDKAIELAETHTLGICEVCHDYVDTSLLEMNYTACVCLDHLSEPEKRDLESELELAAEVQKAMLPHRVPDIPCMEIAAYSRPAQIVGGDYFDFSRFNNGNYGLTIGDVAGHGISASLLMASLQAAIGSLIPTQDSPAEVVTRINRLFNHNIHFTTFASLFLYAFDPERYRLTYTNAGHNPPLLLRASTPGAAGILPPLEQLLPTGPVIGLFDSSPYTAGERQLQPGDMLLLYTDGIVETANPQAEFYGMSRLQNQFRRASNLPVAELVHSLIVDLQEFNQSDQFADDTTLIACRIV